jgi:hypothetical protein
LYSQADQIPTLAAAKWSLLTLNENRSQPTAKTARKKTKAALKAASEWRMPCEKPHGLSKAKG